MIESEVSFFFFVLKETNINRMFQNTNRQSVGQFVEDDMIFLTDQLAVCIHLKRSTYFQKFKFREVLLDVIRIVNGQMALFLMNLHHRSVCFCYLNMIIRVCEYCSIT